MSSLKYANFHLADDAKLFMTVTSIFDVNRFQSDVNNFVGGRDKNDKNLNIRI